MKQIFARSAVCMGLAVATPSFAQTQTATAPTLDQCKAGYKADYMKTNNWSKATFDQACAKMMKK